MEKLSHDTIAHDIMPYLSDKDRLSFMQQNKLANTTIRNKTILDSNYYDPESVSENTHIRKAIILDSVNLYTLVLPRTVIMIRFDDEFDKPIPAIFFDNNRNIKDIIFGMYFDQIIEPNVLPSKLNRLEFGFDYNKPIQPGVLPEDLKELKFGNQFNQRIDIGVLPSNLDCIEFGDKFNQPLDMRILPQGLRTLVISTYYNFAINDVPPTLKIIRSNNDEEDHFREYSNNREDDEADYNDRYDDYQDEYEY
jgi:hypothetical protein